jgi:hypothetical protein
MSLNRMFDAVASRYQWQCKDHGGGFWMLYDPQNDIQFSVELTEVDVWTWACSALVMDLDGRSRPPDPSRLLRLNDGQGDEGVVWCFYAIGRHDLGESLYLKYGGFTPLGDLTVASKLLATVLRNMQKFTVRTRAMAQ